MGLHVERWGKLFPCLLRMEPVMSISPKCSRSLPWIFSRYMCKSAGPDNEASIKQKTKAENEDKVTDPPSPENAEDYSNLDNSSSKPSSSSFRSAFDKFSSDEFLNPANPTTPQESFAAMFRNSKFVGLGDPNGKTVVGTIYHIVGDDLYVDFGWKFPCVVQRPHSNSEFYVRNAKVRLRIIDLEMSTRFLGGTSEMSLNEADCRLIGLISSPLGRVKQEYNLE